MSTLESASTFDDVCEFMRNVTFDAQIADQVQKCFIKACKVGNLEIIRALHDHEVACYPKFWNNTIISEPDLPYHYGTDISYIDIAATYDNLLIIKYLIAKKYNYEKVLCIAASHGYMDIINYFCEFKLIEDINSTPRNYSLNPLNIACTDRQIDVISKLLTHGARPDNKSLLCVFDEDILKEEDEKIEHIVKLLVTQGASAYLDRVHYWFERTIAGVAIMHRLQKTFEFIKSLDNRYELNFKDIHGRTILHTYPYYRRCEAETIKYILKNGADVNAQDNMGKTPLHMACKKGSVKYIRILIENGADVNAKDNNGNTPLHKICRRIFPYYDILANINKFCKILIDHGIDTTILNNNGDSALNVLYSVYPYFINETDLLLGRVH
jgi:ankyrin repeat protein